MLVAKCFSFSALEAHAKNALLCHIVELGMVM